MKYSETLSLDEQYLVSWLRTLNAWDIMWLVYMSHSQDVETLAFLRSRFLDDDTQQVLQIPPPVGRE